MTREEEIINKGIEYTMNHHPMCIGGGAFADAMREFNRNAAFEAGAKWADEHPNRNLVYTKQELRDMGFGFDLNGNIKTIKEIEESHKKHNEYRKNKLINKACQWLESIDFDMGYWNSEEGFCKEMFINDFIKTMEE